YVVDETLSPGQGCCAELVTGAAEGHGVEHERGIRHSTCDRARGGKADQVEGEWGLGDPATTGFESENTAGGRRDAEGSTTVAAVDPSASRQRRWWIPPHPGGRLRCFRRDPPPSLPWATGASPAATATAAPPLEPPGVRVVSQGLRVA